MTAVPAIVLGATVWAGIAGIGALWLAVTALSARLPHAGDLVRWFLGSWLGRLVAIAAWAAAGWHVFCQRP